MKRPTDDNLRRRVAKVKRLLTPYRYKGAWWCNAPLKSHRPVSNPANWLESLDAAVALLEELPVDDWSIETYGDGYKASVKPSHACWAAFLDKSLCRACCLAYLAVKEKP